MLLFFLFCFVFLRVSSRSITSEGRQIFIAAISKTHTKDGVDG